MQYIFIALVLFGVFASFKNWRYGLYWIVIIGALQDPVRKMTPGAPSYFVLSTLPVWLAILPNFWRRERRTLLLFSRLYSRLKLFFFCFLATLIPGAIVMLSYGLDTLGAVALGAFSYIAPMIGVLVGFVFIREQEALGRLLSFYCLVTAIVLIGTPLEYFNIFPGWNALGTAVLNMHWIKYVGNMTIHMKAGFYRSPDVMGWHAATMTILSIILFLQGRSLLFPRWLCLVLAVWGALCIIMSGRYKMIATTFVWAGAFTFLLLYTRKRSRIVVLCFAAALAIIGANTLAEKLGIDEGFLIYASSPLDYSTERLEKHGIGSVLETYKQSGFWGRGLGSATQGTQHTARVEKGWQEGGVAKLIAELGVPGLCAFILLLLVLLRSLLRVIRLSVGSPDITYWGLGLISIFLANGTAFIVSYQIFGDPYILILITFLLGVALSVPRILSEKKAAVQQTEAGLDLSAEPHPYYSAAN